MASVFIEQHENPDTTSNLIRWYKFDDNLNDSSGSGFNLTAESGTTYDYTSDFNGIANLLTTEGGGFSGYAADSRLASGNDYSFCAWYYSFDSGPTFIFYDDTATGGSNVGLQVYIDGTSWYLVTRASGPTATNYYAAHGLSGSTWYHLCLTFDYSANQVKYYRNGVYVNNDTDTSTNWDSGETEANYAGGYNFAGSYNSKFGDLRVYDGVLSASEVKALYKYLGS